MRSNFNAHDRSVFEIILADLHDVTFCLYICALARLKACEKGEMKDDDERETKTRETHKAKSVTVRKSRI